MTEPRITAREFASERGKVTVGLLDGETQVGFVDAFDPREPHLSLYAGDQGPSPASSTPLQLATEQLSFVAFHGERTLPAEGEEALRVCEIHVPGARSFTVLVSTQELGIALGFYGRPKSR